MEGILRAERCIMLRPQAGWKLALQLRKPALQFGEPAFL
jgi:hypothetical protein